MADVITGLVVGAGEGAHKFLARTDLEREARVWIMRSEDEAAAIAKPLANIAQRRAGGQMVSTDLNDLISLGVAAAGYLIHNAVKTLQLRRAARQMSGLGINPDAGEPTEGE